MAELPYLPRKRWIFKMVSVTRASANTLYARNVILVLACTLLLVNQDCQQAFKECLTSFVHEHLV